MRISDWSSDVCSSDLAGIGEKPITRSGPYCFTVYRLEAAMISLASSQCTRAKPPMPRRVLYSLVLAGSSTMLAQASTGDIVLRASRHKIGRASCRERECQYV